MATEKSASSKAKSAGILLYRYRNSLLQVFLVHPGGPFWSKKDLGSWSIPKGEISPGEDLLNAAKREMEEETGIVVEGTFIELTAVKQKGGKMVYAWALQKDVDPATIKSNLFEMEWPPRSGLKKAFPEIDKAGWFTPEDAHLKILEAQRPLITELESKLATARKGL